MDIILIGITAGTAITCFFLHMALRELVRHDLAMKELGLTAK